MIHHHVTITFRDNKKELFVSTELPSIGSDWITVYDYDKRTYVPAQAIQRIESTPKSSPKKK